MDRILTTAGHSQTSLVGTCKRAKVSEIVKRSLERPGGGYDTVLHVMCCPTVLPIDYVWTCSRSPSSLICENCVRLCLCSGSELFGIQNTVNKSLLA